jgi:capsule polysaccharide export protein KpsE/RkpR
MNALEGRFLEVENRVVRSEAVVQENTRRVDTVEARQMRLEQEMERERERVRRERTDEMRERERDKKEERYHAQSGRGR